MKKLNDLQAFVYVSIISADNDEFGLTEDQKQDIMARYNESKDDPNWAYILECMPDEKQKSTLIKFLSEEEKDEESVQKHASHAGSCGTSSKTLEPSKESTKSV